MNAGDRRTQKIINLVNQAEVILDDPEFNAGDSSAQAIELVIAIIGIVARSGFETIGMLDRAKDTYKEQCEELEKNKGMN